MRISESSGVKTSVIQKENVLSYFDKNDAWQDELYDGLDDYQSRLLRRRREYAIYMLKNQTALGRGKVLDVGCGSGAFLKELRDMGFDVTGVDISQGMLAASRKRLGVEGHKSIRVHLVPGDIECLPFQREEFDLVICIGVVGYLFQDEQALSEIYRVLKPGGHLLIYLSNVYSLFNIDFVFRQRAKSFLKLRSKEGNCLSIPEYALEMKWAKDHEKFFYKAYNPWKYERVLATHGFKLISAITFGFEFRRFRRLHLLPASWFDKIELSLERLIHRYNIPYFSYSGWMYLSMLDKTA